jgi:PAS domain S-box-containing protein
MGGQGTSTSLDEGRHAAELLELGDAFFELDREWRIVRVNQRQEQLSRKPRSETLGRTFAEVWPELATESSRYWREYRRCMEERVRIEFEDYYAPLDLWTGVTAYPVSDGGIAVFFRDINAIKRAEGEARQRAAEVEAVLGSVGDGVLVYDRDGRILRANIAAEVILGLDPHAMARPARERVASAGTEWFDERGERLSAEDLPALRAARLGETRRGAVLRMRPPYGVEKWLRVTAAPLVVGGIRIGATASLADITEAKRAEQALRESEARLRAAHERLRIEVESSPLALVEWDSEFRVVGYSGRAEELFGWSRDEVLGKRIDEIPWIPEEDWPSVRAVMRDMASGARPINVNANRNLRKDGRTIACEWYNSTLRDESGRLTSVLSLVLDVTQRERAEASLREANERLREEDRRKDEFLGMLSHELRNPLAPIRNALYILDRAPPEGPQARRAKDIVARQVAHLTRLVDDLLDVTRIARGKIELRREELDLAGLALRAAEDYRPLMQERALELALQVPPAPVVVEGDPARLTQVLGNLLSNAAKFTPAGGGITLAVGEEGDRAVVHVRDTGVGIAPEVLPTIFEPFIQGKRTLARSEGGLGLGLALVKGLVAMHGGEVAAVSEGAGRGTDLVVSLPLASGPRGRAAAGDRAVRPSAAAPLRVLVIDDNRDAADTLAQLVEMLGHTAVVAYDPYDALAKATEELPQVALCDLGLPGMDGYELARRLRALASDRGRVRLVALSGYAQPEDVARARAAGFDAHVAKPPDPLKLEQLLA